MNNQDLRNEIQKACKRIAPAWPLKNSVAVNPYLGLSDMSFQRAAKILSDRGSINIAMPIQFYLDQYDKMVIQPVDLHDALYKNNKHVTIEEFIKDARFFAVTSNAYEKYKAHTLIDSAEEITGKHWNELMVDSISSWASSYFDEYQTLWKTTDSSEFLYQAWKKDAEIDLSPEIMGIKNFRSIIRQLPDTSFDTAALILQKLDIPDELIETYLHALLLKIVGWSSFIAGKDWDNSLYGGNSTNLASFMTILLSWEYSLYISFKDKGIKKTWDNNKAELKNHTENETPNEYLEASVLLQDAYDFACQRQLEEKFNSHDRNIVKAVRPKAQAVFCIDVRSEVYRRNLERVDPEIETVGFAGFFGFPINYTPLGHSHGKNQCPVLIPSGPVVKESFSKEIDKKAIKTRQGKHQVEKTWKLFKAGAISSFSFVSPLGLSYLPKLISDSFGWTRPKENPNEDGLAKWIENGRDLDLSEIKLKDKITMAASALTAMGLKDNLAPIVLITGHGSTSVNNPHATGLDCGACGGHSGEINAMTAEKILNDPDVRNGLKEMGIEIPSDTHFVACLHDTTTDTIHILGEKDIPYYHQVTFFSIKDSLQKASNEARAERAQRLNINPEELSEVFKRSNDWSQVRPEWGLAGCNSFIIAPRKRTAGLNLGGKSFLHSYNWKTDDEFKILETIMTAPMVVTSWINLQYYGSTTDNEHFGAGNKTLHNVTGGFGVLEGSSGDLRIGLPLQSIHDGKSYQHLPLRLNVVIEAPKKAINDILEKHPGVKDLCDNSWITLLAMDENGKIGYRYSGSGEWEDLKTKRAQEYQREIVSHTFSAKN